MYVINYIHDWYGLENDVRDNMIYIHVLIYITNNYIRKVCSRFGLESSNL